MADDHRGQEKVLARLQEVLDYGYGGLEVAVRDHEVVTIKTTTTEVVREPNRRSPK